MKDAELIDT